MAPIVQKVEGITSELSEAPHWDVESQALYFVDIFGNSIHRYVPSKNQHTKASLDQIIGFIIPVKGQKQRFVISQGKDIVAITWDGVSDKVTDIQKIGTVGEKPEHVVNDAKADHTGRLWTGTRTGPGEFVSSFVSLEKGKITTHLTNVGLSNGIAFSKSLKKLYHVDTQTGSVDQYDINFDDGSISNKQSVFTLSKHDITGGCDGITIDTDGNLWVAVFNAFKLLKIDPRKPETLLQTITLPARQVTSVAFGGANLDELYVTTGRIQYGGEFTFTEYDGCIYKITGLNAKGFAPEEVVL